MVWTIVCACRKDPGPVQLNRLAEFADGNVGCSVKAVVLFSSLLRLLVGGRNVQWWCVVGGEVRTERSRDVDG